MGGSDTFMGLLIPILAILMPVFIVGIVFLYKARDKELQIHQDLHVRDLQHQQKMKELELEIEKTKAGQRSGAA